ncbi:hypothetical protein RHSIM_Rhsim13G0193700 [Rhododendron simsii]|uniref:Uncharacterized protein n=1 Tax=Rhododendron simsii TaxID=118357 RepID=A0A834L6K4_RHOSS|nr:hypothetical protein RHSIM_Rhsim13G0193700 [Rhododendron simsii]
MGGDMRYEIGQNAYIKLVLQALNHKTSAVNGLLLGRLSAYNNDVIEITESELAGTFFQLRDKKHAGDMPAVLRTKAGKQGSKSAFASFLVLFFQLLETHLSHLQVGSISFLEVGSVSFLEVIGGCLSDYYDLLAEIIRKLE